MTEYRRPPPGPAATDVDVLVVGVGPVGLAMAAAVGQDSISEFLRAHGRALVAITPGLGRGLHGDSPRPAGTLSIQCRLADGRSMDEELGRRRAVLAASEQEIPRLPRDLAPLSGDRHPEVRDFLDTLSSRFAVIRPDGHHLGSPTTSRHSSRCRTAPPSRVGCAMERQRRPVGRECGPGRLRQRVP